MDTDAMARLDARMERMETALQRVVGLLDQVQPQLAMAVDIADDWASTRVGGDHLERRLASVEAALLQLSEPSTLDSLVRLAQLGPRLERAANLAAGLDDTVAMGADIVDEWIGQGLGGDQVDERLQAAREALLVLSDPQVLASLSSMAGQAPQLQRLVDLGAGFEDTVAMAADIADDWVRDELGGDAFDSRLSSIRAAALTVSEPSVVDALRELAVLAPRLVGTARTAADLGAIVESMASVVGEPVEPVGLFGLLSSLRDPDVQRGLGRALHLARHLGRNETLLPVKR